MLSVCNVYQFSGPLLMWCLPLQITHVFFYPHMQLEKKFGSIKTGYGAFIVLIPFTMLFPNIRVDGRNYNVFTLQKQLT